MAHHTHQRIKYIVICTIYSNIHIKAWQYLGISKYFSARIYNVDAVICLCVDHPL